MGNNKKEEFIFISMICGTMVPATYGVGVVRSLSLSLPINYLIVTPLIKKIFVKIFPPIVEDIEEDLQEKLLKK